jgi:hypothetical protein
MHADEQNRLQKLAAGQLWRVEPGYLYIVERGDRIIRYKMVTAPSSRAAITQMVRIEAMLNFLKQSEAELIATDAPSAPADPRPSLAAAQVVRGLVSSVSQPTLAAVL